MGELQKVVLAAKKKTQNTSLDKYELLWDVESQLKDVNVETIKALQGKFLNLFLKDIVKQDPTPPLRRVISQWIVKLCNASGAVSQALTAIKAFQNILPQKGSLVSKISALECMGMLYKGLGVAVASGASDSANILKNLKQIVSDKDASVRIEVANLLGAIGAHCAPQHFDTLLSYSVKLCEDPSPHA